MPEITSALQNGANPGPSAAGPVAPGQEALEFTVGRPPADRQQAAWVMRPDGHSERIADYRRMFSFYYDLVENTDIAIRNDPRAHDRMLRDGQIFSALRIRQLATACKHLTITPLDDSGPARLAADRTKAMIGAIRNWPQAKLNMMSSLAYGLSVQEIEWVLDDGLRFMPSKLYPVHISRVRFDTRNNLVLVSPNDVFYGEKLPPRTFLTQTYDPEGGDFGSSPEDEGRVVWGHGLLDRIYPWYVWKSIVMRIMLRASEKLVSGTLVGMYPYRNTQGAADIMRAMDGFQNNAKMTWPSDAGFDIKHFPHNGSGVDLYKQIIHYFDEQMTKIIMGSALMMGSEANSGSYALLEVHERSTYGQVVKFDAEIFLDTCKDQLVRYLFEMNGWDTRLMPTLGYQSSTRWSLTEVINACDRLIEMGYPVSWNVISEETGIRQPSPGESVIRLRPWKGSVEKVDGENGPLTNIKVDFPQEMPEIIKQRANGRSRISMNGVGAQDNVQRFAESGVALAADTGEYEQFSYNPAAIMQPTTPVAEAIAKAGIQRKLVWIEYTTLADERRAFILEPYCFRLGRVGPLLFGHDVKDGQTKSWRLGAISGTQTLTASRFAPRWRVEFQPTEKPNVPEPH